MNVLELLKNRKSVRIYTGEKIDSETKRKIMQASLEAPTAGNMALYSIIDVQDQAIKDQLADLCDHQPFIKSADMVLVYVVDYQKWMDMFQYYDLGHSKMGESDLILALEDTCIAAQNAVIAAESLGIGSCYIGDIMENYELTSKLLNLPQYVMPLVMVVFGYPTDQQKNRKKPKRFELEDMIHINSYEHKTIEQTKEMFLKQTEKTEEELADYILRFYKRKMDAPFSKEMIRSVKVMLERWTSENENAK